MHCIIDRIYGMVMFLLCTGISTTLERRCGVVYCIRGGSFRSTSKRILIEILINDKKLEIMLDYLL